jgi:hypothetical protein
MIPVVGFTLWLIPLFAFAVESIVLNVLGVPKCQTPAYPFDQTPDLFSWLPVTLGFPYHMYSVVFEVWDKIGIRTQYAAAPVVPL